MFLMEGAALHILSLRRLLELRMLCGGVHGDPKHAAASLDTESSPSPIVHSGPEFVFSGCVATCEARSAHSQTFRRSSVYEVSCCSLREREEGEEGEEGERRERER